MTLPPEPPAPHYHPLVVCDAQCVLPVLVWLYNTVTNDSFAFCGGHYEEYSESLTAQNYRVLYDFRRETISESEESSLADHHSIDLALQAKLLSPAPSVAALTV